MQFLFLGLLLLIFILFLGSAFVKADTKTLAQRMRKAGGYTVLIFALGLAVTGRIVLALPLVLAGLSLLGKRTGIRGLDDLLGTQKSAGQRSSVRTDMLEMVLDHDSGSMDGVVNTGEFAGRRLSEMSLDELKLLLEDAQARDPKAAQLLDAFIESRFSEYRQSSGENGRQQSGGRSSAMTVDEAYDVLGLRRDASREEIQTAHRNLMKKHHPDQGGSTYLAAKINEAKDLLLSRTE